MKRILKKVMPALLTLAMVFTMVAVPSVKAKAAENVTLYFKLPAGWTANTTGYNFWGDSGVAVSGSGNTVIAPSSWDSTHARTIGQVTDATGGWVSVVVNDSAKLKGIQLISAYGAQDCAYSTGDGDNLWNATVASLGLSSAYFDTTTNKWYKEKACTNEVLPPVLDDIYYVTGDEGLTGANWGATPTGGLMTEGTNGVFSVEFTVATAGTYAYKVLQDPADFGWTNPYTAESNGAKATENGSITTTVDGSTVKISINSETKIVTVTVTKPQGSGNEGGQGSGNEGQGSGNEGQGSGNEGQGSGNEGQGSGDVNNETETDTVKIYAKVSSEWETVNAYAWKDGADFYEVAKWPGTAMTSLGDGWYVISVPKDIDRIIFNNGNGVQTDNITLTAGKAAAFSVAADGKFEETNVPLNYKGGDNNNMVVYIMMMLAGAGLAAVAIAKRRQATK